MKVIIFIISLLFFPAAVSAEGGLGGSSGSESQPDQFQCYCNYKQLKDVTKTCSESWSKTLEVGLGTTWNIGSTNPQYDEFEGKFLTTDKCVNLLQGASDEGMVCQFDCKLQKKILNTWYDWYDLKWLTNVGTKANPIQVKEGEISTPVEIIASGSTSKNIKVICTNCTDPGLEVKSEPGSGKGKAIIIWDTSKSDLITQLYTIYVKAYVVGTEKDTNAETLLGQVIFSVTGVSPVQTTSTVDAWIKSQYGKPKDYAGALPDCAFSGDCRSVNDLLQLIINFASALFMILGSFAFAFFVYGGFKMIISMGNAEMVETGKKTMIAAALGLVVATLAYTAIDLMLDILNVSPEFRGIK